MATRISMHLSGRERTLTFDGGPPRLNSATTAWAGPAFELHGMCSREVAGESGPLDGECGLLIVTEGQIQIVAREGKRELTRALRPGSLVFVSGEERAHVLRMKGEAEGLALHLSETWFERLLIGSAPPRLAHVPRLHGDATILALGRAMRDEVARGAPTGRLYAESLSMALLSYAFRGLPPSGMATRGRLPDEQQRRLRNYILDRLGEDLSVSELAALVGLGARQFSTLFRRAFGVSPHRYIINARLAEGARLLAAGGGDVADIAARLGFSSQSHFAEAFRRVYGVTPRSYAADRRVSGTSRLEHRTD